MTGKSVQAVVGMGDVRVTEHNNYLRAVGIGSCVAITLHDRHMEIGGLAHAMLPCREEGYDKSQPGRFADAAIGMLVAEMRRRGSEIKNIRAKIFGGANMFPVMIPAGSDLDIGKRNVLAVREELRRYDIEIIAEEVGGHINRTVLFDIGDGSVAVRAACLKVSRY